MNGFLHALHFLRPEWLWALAALLPGVALWRWRQRRADVWRGAVDPALAPHVLVGGGRASLAGLLLACLAHVLAVLALAGPAWRQEAQPMWQVRTPLVIALDLSSATQAGDLPPSRLLQARAKLATLLREREGGEMALVAWAEEAFTVAPLTDDAANVAVFLDALSPAVMPVDGQRADRAIAWSAQLMRQAGFPHGRILLVTDHADGNARAAARQAAAQGYATSVLGLGTPQGAAYRDAAGSLAEARLDESSLAALARDGRGRYARLQAGDGDLHALGVLSPSASDEGEGHARSGNAWRDEGYWLLPPLMLLGLLAFRRRAGLAAMVLVLALPLAMPAPAHAAEPGGTWWRRADQVQQRRLASGVQAYRKGDYAAAQADFSGVDSDQGWYNLGNALARQGHYDQALHAYDQALAHHPGMADAIANRAAVEAARKREQQQRQQNPQASPGKQGQKPPPSGGGQPQPTPGGSGAEGAHPPGQDGRREAGQPSGKDGQPKPADAHDQRQADAEQRQRMQQALADAQARKQDGGQGEGQQQHAAPETAQQRERRQANEAWLRRIPDDPGSLLRNKFELEYRRRQQEGP